MGYGKRIVSYYIAPEKKSYNLSFYSTFDKAVETISDSVCEQIPHIKFKVFRFAVIHLVYTSRFNLGFIWPW